MKKPYKAAEFVTAPAVFAVKEAYQITVPVTCEMLFWVEIGERKYFDHSNGILRSATSVHRVSVPMEVLDEAGAYTVCYRKIIERKPYYPETEETKKLTYSFYPVGRKDKINIYHLSDTHGSFAIPCKTGTYFGDDIDLLILNGDIFDHSGSADNFYLAFQLCEAITGGEHPCVYSRGNHDLRGYSAEKMEAYFPTDCGKSYYTFRLGKLWGIVLDCGEDKADEHEEYGGTVCCSAFREEVTQFLESVTEKGEYRDEGIETKMVIVHNPFTFTLEAPFDIEQDCYQNWTEILKNGIQPDLMLAGHLHLACVSNIGGDYDSKGQPCPVIIGSEAIRNDENEVTDFIGCALTLDGKKITVAFTDSKHRIVRSETVETVPQPPCADV